MASQYHVNQRISFESALCTVRYIGTVKGTQKDWLGVEWDDPTRGKHDGEHNGKSRAKAAASFVRPSRASVPPQSFVKAVHEKYASEVTSQGLAGSKDSQIEISGKVVEEVGFDKIRMQLAQLHELKIVLVDGLRVREAETSKKDIRDVCPSIIELDISRNLFESYEEVVRICEQLNVLRSLRINGNRLLAPKLGSSEKTAERAFQGVKELGVDETLWSWEEICAFTQKFTNLTTLTASSNELKLLRPSVLPSASRALITSINLEYNDFGAMSDLSILASLPTLESLILKGNKISRISSDMQKKHLVFGNKLRHIDLSYNQIATWNFLDSLPDTFPGLNALRSSNNPLYNRLDSKEATTMSVEEGYMLTLARLANLKILNYSNISAAERTNAELFYLSRIAKSMADVPESKESSITNQHRRYQELCEIYGEPIVVRSDGVFIDPNYLEARLIKFTFRLAAKVEEAESKQESIKIVEIPKGYDVYQVKGVVGRLFGLRPLSMRFVWETGEWDPVADYEEYGEVSEDDDYEKEDEVVAKTDSLDTVVELTSAAPAEKPEEKAGKWMEREVEIEDSTRQIGFCVDGTEARIRIELR